MTFNKNDAHAPQRGLLLEMLWSALPGRPFPTVLDMASPGSPVKALGALGWAK